MRTPSKPHYPALVILLALRADILDLEVIKEVEKSFDAPHLRIMKAVNEETKEITAIAVWQLRGYDFKTVDGGSVGGEATGSEQINATLMKYYPYKPLNPSRYEFRRLQFDSDKLIGKPPYPLKLISGSLHHVSLNDNRKYEALSYAWGSPADPKQILVDGIFLGGTKVATFDKMFTSCHAMGLALGTNIMLNPNKTLHHVLSMISVREVYSKDLKPLVVNLLRIHNTPGPVKATDTRARIYGVLALASDIEKPGIKPGYTRSVKETYIDAARRVIHGGCPNVLNFEERISENEPGLQRLVVREMNAPVMGVRGHLSDDNGRVGLDGAIVDEVEYVDRKYSTFDIPWLGFQRMQIRLEEIANLRQRSKLYSQEQKYEAQWRVPIVD
ncbi:hypothetical protein G7Y89_g1348 [Cudoniella acicularis]|uniref:Uncharacterized protein n=1 Tax=Cudoniella acicularis TaxID=354080 RepID=A0A8H4WAD5_9HELO|nr:hypothetical protein G7Y89_g1348 [Cudoniella acicularis]